MVPSQRALAELALRRQEDLSRQLSATPLSPSASLLPGELRRAIVTVSVCHETLRSLEAGAEDRSQTNPTYRPEDSGFPPPYRAAQERSPGNAGERANGARLWRANLALPVDSARIAYWELLSASDWVVQRRALDSFLDYLTNLESVKGAAGPAASFKSVADSARRIRILLEARRQTVEASNVLYRELESLTVEGMAWSYCAALLAETFRRGPGGSSGAREAVERVDELRAALEKPQPTAAPARPPLDERSQRPSETAKP
jgi:hypothetical protein